MRGLAALGVVLFHLKDQTPHWLPAWLYLIFGLCGAGPFVFFVISGYVIYQSLDRGAAGVRPAVVFLGKRVRRIYPAFLMSLPLAFIVPVLGWGVHYSVGALIAIVTLTYLPFHVQSPQAVYWTLVIEQQFYVMAALTLSVPFLWRRRVPLLLASSVLAVIGLLARDKGGFLLTILPAYWREFLLGIVAFLIVGRRVSRWAAWPVLLLLVAFPILRGQYWDIPGPFTLIIITLHRFDSWLAGRWFLYPLQWLGKISYSLYLVHFPIIFLCMAMFRRFLPFDASHDPMLVFSVPLLCSLATAVPFYWLCERPFLSASRKTMLAERNTGDTRIPTAYPSPNRSCCADADRKTGACV
jgi:peptidoglycan/LPS O-acetylase OafA/YrhL